MAPSFKITFPLPGRRTSASPHSTPSSQYSPQNEFDASPRWRPASKAEELLGAGTPDSLASGNTAKRNKLRKDQSQRSLRKLPSFMSMTLADVDGESPQSDEPEEFPFPGMISAGTFSGAQSPARGTNRLSRHGSSPLLGQQPPRLVSQEVDYFTDGARHIPHYVGPSSKSPARPPVQTASSFLIDQQSPASPPQEANAPAEGNHAPISQASEMLSSTTVPDGIKSHSRNISKESEGSKGTGASMIASIPRRRPSVMDRPTLYPNAPRPWHAVTPPPALINASLPKSMQVGNVPASGLGKIRWWKRRKMQLSPPAENVEATTYNPQIIDGNPSVKVNRVRPTQAASNWFDNIGTDDAALETSSLVNEMSQLDTTDEPSPEALTPFEPVYANAEQEDHSDIHSSPSSVQRKSSFSSKTRRAGLTERKLSFKLDGPPSGLSQSRASSRLSYSKSAPGSPTCHRSLRSVSSQRGITFDIDLQIESVLSLSSSEDEGEPSGGESQAQTLYADLQGQKPVFGRSISHGTAIAGRQAKSRVNTGGKSSRRAGHRRSTSLEAVPPVPQIPLRPQLDTRSSSSSQWRELLEAKDKSQCAGTTTEAEAGDSTVDSGASSATDVGASTGPIKALSNRYGKRTSSSLRGSKLMKVTMEEEQLLEAMREKRASIRSNDFQKGFSSAMQQMRASDLISRPRTAGADGPGTNTARSSVYAASATTGITVPSTQGSTSPLLLAPAVYRPPPGAKHIYKASLGTISRLSASADDLTIEDSYPFPHVPSEPLRNSLAPSLTSSPRPPFGPLNSCPPTLDNVSLMSAPSLSYGPPSDTLPPTPSTRGSPLTPPPGVPNGMALFAGGERGSSVSSSLNRKQGDRHSTSPPRSSGSVRSTPSRNQPAQTTGLTKPVNGTDNALHPAPATAPTSNPSTANSTTSNNTSPQSLARISKRISSQPSPAAPNKKSVLGVEAQGLPSKISGHGHERQRTTSSSVVVLDGMESYAARVDEENDIAGWAMERW